MDEIVPAPRRPHCEHSDSCIARGIGHCRRCHYRHLAVTKSGPQARADQNREIAQARCRNGTAGVAEIDLTRGYVALVDSADLERLSRYCWQAFVRGGTVRATRADGGHSIFMHREILDAPRGISVDHINGDALDNRRANLRLCSVAENNCNVGVRRDNRSGFKGVRRDRDHWIARIQIDRRPIYLGFFHTAEEAARAYDRAAITHHGAFARLNFPGEFVS